MSDPVSDSGLFASLRRFMATALEVVQVRLDLLGTEIEFEKRRLFEGVLWAAAALLVLGIGLVLLCGFVILLFWDGYRLAAIGVLALLFLAGGLALLFIARRHLRKKTSMFNFSLSELENDRAALFPIKSHECR